MSKKSFLIWILMVFLFLMNLNTVFSMNEETIKITVDNKEINATLIDNPATCEFISQLPLKLQFHDLFGREKYAYLPHSLNDRSGLVDTYDVGMIAYYPPTNAIAIYYAQDGEKIDEGIIPIAKLTENDVKIFEKDIGNVTFEFEK